MSDPFIEDLVSLLPRLRRFALSLTRNADLADDLVQLAAERAIARRGTWDPASNLAAWMFRILRNAWIDQLRRNRSRGEAGDLDEMADLPGADGRQETETRLMLGSALEAMALLPDEQREVMHLICIEETSYAEAAAILELPVGTVMSRLSRARLSVARRLGIK